MAYLEDRNKSAGVTAPADPFTLQALIAWLRTKDAQEVYCWENAGRCLYSQYGVAIGAGSDGVSAYSAAIAGFKLSGAADALGFRKAEGAVANGYPRTFGAALSRALAIQAGAK